MVGTVLGVLEGAPETDGFAEGCDDGFSLGRVLIDGFWLGCKLGA